MSNNEGGFIVLAHFINSLLFPNANPSFPTNFRLTEIVKKAIEKANDINNPIGSIFNFNGYLNADGLPFNNTSEFLQSKFIENDLTGLNQFLFDLPWKSSDMIILTNGYCGSSCSSTSLLFSELHNVP